MRRLVLIFLLLVSGCSNKNTHYIYPCGVEVASCKVEVEGKMSLEEQEKIMKHKMMSAMNLIIDNILQNLLRGM